jgi:hypothetical protein
MRMERLIVPMLSVLALGWAVAQTMAGLLFEWELTRAIADLQARGELLIQRSHVSKGWLASRGVLHLSPLLDDSWHLDVTYRARHGVFDTDLDGTLQPHLESEEGDESAARNGQSPSWKARYHMLTSTFDGALELSPLELRQQNRSLTLKGGRVAFHGGFGDWQVRARLESARLEDGDRRFEGGPFILESRYAYTQGAYHFTQDDLLKLANLRWISPDLTLAGDEAVLTSHTVLDEEELRVHSELDLGQIYAAGEVLLSGSMSLELSRLNADALRDLLNQLRNEATTRHGLSSQELTYSLRRLMQDSPRLDLLDVSLDSPMLGVGLNGDGVLIFDARNLQSLDPLNLAADDEQARWRRHLDGDFLWRKLPPVVALWLGLPLGTQDLQIDVVRGKVRINGRPLPWVLHWLQ